MPKSLHHCCRIYCSLDAKITALVVAENTALLVTVHNLLELKFALLTALSARSRLLIVAERVSGEVHEEFLARLVLEYRCR